VVVAVGLACVTYNFPSSLTMHVEPSRYMRTENSVINSNDLPQERLRLRPASAYFVIASTLFPGRPGAIDPESLLTGKDAHYDLGGIYQWTRRPMYV
jgi:hypothetical protein